LKINDPIHGFIEFSEIEQKIINSEAFQRLRRIKQLSGAHYVYPTAEHNRFGHSLGAMYLAGLMCKRVAPYMNLDDDVFQEIRIAGLLHDIGHGPFSHVFEEALIERRGWNHEDATEWLICESELGDILETSGMKKVRIADLVRGKYKSQSDMILAGLVAGQVDADKMDYLIRDSYYCGVNYGLIDFHRLINSLEVSEDHITYFDLAARGALEAFLVARYEMFLNVYYHKTVRSVEIMLVKMITAADSILNFTDFSTPDEYLKLDDASLITEIRKINSNDSEEAYEAAKLVKRLDSRILYKSAFEKVLHTQDKFVSKILTKRKVRHSIEEEIAESANVPPEEIIVDVPTLPSIPYNPNQLNPMEIRIFELIDGKRQLHNLSEYSNIAEMMKVYLDVIRVYTSDQYRTEVGRASREIFRELPDTALIHM
jgi:hypothetical protein